MGKAYPPFGTKLYVPPSGGGSDLTITASTWRFDGNSGTVKVSSGFPFQPGQVTASNLSKVRVYVNNVEQAVAVKAMDGAFPDGSYRSIGIQFSYNLTNNTPITSSVVVGTSTRGTSDIAWVEPNYTDIVSKKAVIAPTSPAHLCGTFVTLGPLTPKSNDSGVNATWAQFGEDSFLTGGVPSGGIADGRLIGTATYDTPGGLWQLYCRTGVRTWYEWAYNWACEQVGSTVIDTESQGAHLAIPYMIGPHVGVPGVSVAQANCGGNSTYNPESLEGTNGSCGALQENYSLRISSMAPSYWFTAWRQHKRLIAKHANWGLQFANTGYTAQRDWWISTSYGQRLNFGQQGMISVLVGYLTGCTSPVDNFSLGGNTNWDYATLLPWMLDALEETIWNLPGDYRNGLVGQRHTTVAAHGGDEHWGITNFQLTIVTEFLMMYYDNVKPDSRIPGWIKAICDYQIGQSKAVTPLDQTYPDSPYVSSYDNLPPAQVADTTFTATITSGSPTMTWVSGTVPSTSYLINNFVKTAGTGIPAFTYVLNVSGNTITMSANATATGTRTVQIPFAGYYLMMFGPAFAWYYAYSGDSTYNTWAARTTSTASIAMANIKNWGEVYGGARQSFLYYRNGGTIRGTAGVHPTVITNPPSQPGLG